MKAYLSGDQPLWKAFWVFTVGGLLAIGVLGYGIYLAGAAAEIPTAQVAIIYGVVCLVPYSILCLVAVWRNSRNTESKFWSVLARMGVVLIIASYFVGVINV